MTEDTISQMLENHAKDTFDTPDSDESVAVARPSHADVFDNINATPLERHEAYVDYLFENHEFLGEHVDRGKLQVCVADWDKRRGQARYNCKMKKVEFGGRVHDTKWRTRRRGHYSIFVSKPLVGVPPSRDKGKGWKKTVRHELGHVVDHVQRGTSDHGPKFKEVMSLFGPNEGDGYCGGYYPSYHRRRRQNHGDAFVESPRP